MSRIARVVVPGLPHHITQRGNYRQDVFLTADDNERYFGWINEYSIKYNLSILAYCLMPNHVHFIAIPFKDTSLANTFKTAHMRYSQYFNKKSMQRGHLWQGRFYSCVLDERHLILAARYIERNPVRAGLVEKPWQWPWSSASAHTNGGIPWKLAESDDLLRLIGMSADSWKGYIDYEEDKISLQNIRKHTLTGRPLGTATFIDKLEEKSGRRLHALAKGRPFNSQ